MCHTRKGKYGNQIIATVLASLPVYLVGCAVGWTTPTIKKLQQADSPLPITKSEASWLAAAHEVGHFLSPLPAGFLLTWLGRRVPLFTSCGFILIGWLLIVFTRNVAVLYFVRFLFGLAMGIVFTTTPLYVGEATSAHIRGAFSTTFQGFLYLGHLTEFSIGPWVSYSTLGIISLCIAIAVTIPVFYLYESPLYLLSKGKPQQAENSVSWLLATNNTENIANEMSVLDDMIKDSALVQRNQFKSLLVNRNWARVLIVAATAIAQRFTGMSAVVAYAATTFQSSGGLTADHYTIIFGAIVFVCTFFSAALVDRLGRRPLMLLSTFGCAIAHFVTGYYFYSGTNDGWVPFVSITLFSVLYSLGLGPLVTTLQGELFPPDIRGLGSSITTLSHAASSFAVTKSFQPIADASGMYLNFILYGISCTIATLLAYYFLPETKRKSLRQLQKDSDRMGSVLRT